MKRENPVDRQLRELERIEASLEAPAAGEALGRYLAGKSNVVVAKAVRLAARAGDPGRVPDLVAAFHRFMIDPVKTDKGCLVKVAVAEALLASDDPDEDVFRAGLGHVQMEPVWGGRADTAAPLRALCALGLVRVGAAGVMDELAVLLADPEPDARVGAARALAACGDAATPLLRFKVLTGDAQPLVLAECLGGLMSVAPDDSFAFVAGLIGDDRPEVAPHAAMALAESRRPGAFELPRERWEASPLPEFRESLLLPIALTRHEEAPPFLTSVLASGDLAAATAAVAALAIYRGDPGVRARAEAAIRGPHRARLLGLVERAFG
jgi:hypothetical protein